MPDLAPMYYPELTLKPPKMFLPIGTTLATYIHTQPHPFANARNKKKIIRNYRDPATQAGQVVNTRYIY